MWYNSGKSKGLYGKISQGTSDGQIFGQRWHLPDLHLVLLYRSAARGAIWRQTSSPPLGGSVYCSVTPSSALLLILFLLPPSPSPSLLLLLPRSVQGQGGAGGAEWGQLVGNTSHSHCSTLLYTVLHYTLLP